MCGITAAITLQRSGSFNGSNDGTDSSGEHAALRQQLQKSLESIAHRGPDASGVWVSDDGTIGTGCEC